MSRRRPARNRTTIDHRPEITSPTCSARRRQDDPANPGTRIEAPCGRPTTHDAVLCSPCLRTLETSLTRIAEHHDDLDTIRTGFARFGRSTATGASGPGKGSRAHLGMSMLFTPDGAGTRTSHAVRNMLTGWIRVTLDSWPDLALPTVARQRDHDRPAIAIAELTGWIQRNLHAIAGQDWAVELHADALAAERQLRSLVDRPADRVYLGTCQVCAIVGQTTPLHAPAGARTVTCPADDCGAEHDVDERQQVLAANIGDRLLTLGQIAKLAAYLEHLGDPERIRNRLQTWVTRGRLTSAATDAKGHALYAYGPTLQALRGADVKPATRA